MNELAPLAPREKAVLASVVEGYIATASPVGSLTLSRCLGLGLSAASIRNTMGDLAERGLLDKPHSSAGRVPTVAAFRLYLDTLVKPRALCEAERHEIRSALISAGMEIEDILREAGRILARLSSQVSLVAPPGHDSVKIKSVEFVRLRRGLVKAVLVLAGGLIHQRVLRLDEDIRQDELFAYANYVNRLFANATLAQVRAIVAAEMARHEAAVEELSHKALSLASQAVAATGEREMLVEGAPNIAAHPEFADASQMREVLAAIDTKTTLLSLLDKTVSECRTTVALGREAHPAPLDTLGVVCSPYGGPDHPLGALALVGPVRMDYASILPVISFTAQSVSDILRHHF